MFVCNVCVRARALSGPMYQHEEACTPSALKRQEHHEETLHTSLCPFQPPSIHENGEERSTGKVATGLAVGVAERHWQRARRTAVDGREGTERTAGTVMVERIGWCSRSMVDMGCGWWLAVALGLVGAAGAPGAVASQETCGWRYNKLHWDLSPLVKKRPQRDYSVVRDSWTFYMNVCQNTARVPLPCSKKYGAAVQPGSVCGGGGRGEGRGRGLCVGGGRGGGVGRWRKGQKSLSQWIAVDMLVGEEPLAVDMQKSLSQWICLLEVAWVFSQKAFSCAQRNL